MCGLFGFIANKNKKQLDYETFINLGCSNDIRGGDSVGIFIDQQVEYGVDTKKLFSSFYYSSELLKNTREVNLALGHTRKASIGTIGLHTAQPVVIRNSKTNKIDFVLLHNGTLTNYLFLKNKYLSKVPPHYTDSQIMAYCIYFNGIDLFEEYEGAGMFITVDYRNNEADPDIHFFKGKSKMTKYVQTSEEERPLWILETNKGLWFSSIKEGLNHKAFGTPYKVENLPSNVVLSYKNGKFTELKKIDRTQKYQKEVVNTYQNYYDEIVYPNEEMINNNFSNNNKQLPQIENTTIKYTDSFPISTFTKDPTKMELLKGKYFINEKLADGEYYLSDWGFIPSQILVNYHTKYYFIEGLLIYGKNIYEALLRFAKELKLTSAELIFRYPDLVYNFSHNLKYDNLTKICERINNYEGFYYNGTYFPLFSSLLPTEYTVEGGKIKSAISKSYSDIIINISTFKDKCDEINKISTDEYYNNFLNLI